MNRFLGPASLGVSLLALVIALVGSRAEPPPPPPPAAESTESSFSDLEVDALDRRMKNLEENALSLSKRLMLLEQRGGTAPAGGAGGAVPPGLAAEVEQLRAEVRGMVAGEALQSEGGRQYLKDMVRTVQDEMRTEQREQREQRMEEAQAQAQAQRAERLRQFITDARLNSRQEQDVQRKLQAEETQRQALSEAMRSGQKAPRDARQEIRQAREQTDTEIKALLDESQRAKYEELRREDFRRAGPGGGGGGRGERGGGARP